MDSALEIAMRVTKAYRQLPGMAFAYGQGPVVAGFTNDSDLDIVIVWDGRTPKNRTEALKELHNGPGKPIQYDYPTYSLDRFWLNGEQVEVCHKTHEVFGRWIRDVRAGWGWEDSDASMPLYAVAGFAYGRVFADDGRAAAARNELTQFPPLLKERSHAILAGELPSYDRDLAACARRGDGLLFHEMLSRVLRHALVAWFAAENRYCPHPKWLQHWIARFGMDPRIAGLERSLWGPISLERRREIFVAMAERILALK
ncbi:DUF4037 domain-containing protein [Thermasporomyces composti]|uniref:Uncharacterized protein DUF4037 n=1 Tax=Thermasporomyces composti TaxID=696763 RepID=A0A3D9VIJ6_THECX|nr:DUF4037 domain-containing protein [Thermasporomyces composti]REF37131.1 uncharacterized protein DUF4037 [Thermasporomyces composti]